jgi:CheY-like chemotaxis protein
MVVPSLRPIRRRRIERHQNGAPFAFAMHRRQIPSGHSAPDACGKNAAAQARPFGHIEHAPQRCSIKRATQRHQIWPRDCEASQIGREMVEPSADLWEPGRSINQGGFNSTKYSGVRPQEDAIGPAIGQIEMGKGSVDLLVIVRRRCTKHGMGGDHYASFGSGAVATRVSRFGLAAGQSTLTSPIGPPMTEKLVTVLVVEDEAPIRLAIVDDLEVAGFRVVDAANATEAVVCPARCLSTQSREKHCRQASLRTCPTTRDPTPIARRCSAQSPARLARCAASRSGLDTYPASRRRSFCEWKG